MKNIKLIKRRFVTLIEMMIVMFLIALITGVIAYNYRGSLDEGKAFKTKAAIDRLETILNLEAAQHPSFLQNTGNWKVVVQNSPLGAQNSDALLKDGWGEEFEVTSDTSTGAVKVVSRKFLEYSNSHPSSMFGS